MARPTPEVILELAVSEKNFKKKCRQVHALPDSGAACTIVSPELAKTLGAKMEPTNLRLVAANGTAIRAEGIVEIFIKVAGHEGQMLPVDAIVAESGDRLILSWHAMQSVGLLHPSWPVPAMARRLNFVSGIRVLREDGTEMLYSTKLQGNISVRLTPPPSFSKAGRKRFNSSCLIF